MRPTAPASGSCTASSTQRTRRRRCSAAALRAATTTATATSTSTSCAATSDPTCCTATTATTISRTSPRRPASPTPTRRAAVICTAGPPLRTSTATGTSICSSAAWSGDPCLLFENNGDGTFTDVTEQSGLTTMGATNTISASFGDYDLDGDLDMMLAHWGTPRPPDGAGGHGDTESLWRNDSDASGIRFTNVSVESGIAATIIAAARRVSRFPAGRAGLRLHLHADLRAHGRGPLSRHPERRGLQQHARVHQQRRAVRTGHLPRRDGQRRHHRPQRDGLGRRRRRQRRRPRLVRDGPLRRVRDRRQPAVSQRRHRRAAGRDGRGRRPGRRLGLGRLLGGLQPRWPARHLPHQRLGRAEPDRSTSRTTAAGCSCRRRTDSRSSTRRRRAA